MLWCDECGCGGWEIAIPLSGRFLLPGQGVARPLSAPSFLPELLDIYGCFILIIHREVTMGGLLLAVIVTHTFNPVLEAEFGSTG